jgi:hypothetical protein
MKIKHCLIIKEAISKWLSENPKVKPVETSIVCLATRFNWWVFEQAKVKGDSIGFLARELYPYLTADQITKGLMKITSIDGSGICGSGVKYGSV